MEPPEVPRLVLHFNVPQTIMTHDMEGRNSGDEHPVSTQETLEFLMAQQCWGSINGDTREWELQFPDVQAERPDDTLISFYEYCQRLHPISEISDDFTRNENTGLIKQKVVVFVA